MMDSNEYDRVNDAMRNGWIKCQSALDFDAFGKTIDEMSILLSEDDQEAYKAIARKIELDPGRHTPYMKWFNSSRDEMTMEGGPEAAAEGEKLSSFGVHFEFYRGQLDETEHRALPWRAEIMSVTSGFAPLHGVPLNRVVHASYKMGSLGDYDAELRRLFGMGMKPVAHYRNSYGKFSYWMNEEFPWGAPEMPILLKPRVNLRDAG